MTNKKFKLAAMSMALTACVAAQPLMANAADDVDASQNVSPAPQEESTGSSAPATSSSSSEEKKEDTVAAPVVEESKVEEPVEQNDNTKESAAQDNANESTSEVKTEVEKPADGSNKEAPKDTLKEAFGEGVDIDYDREHPETDEKTGETTIKGDVVKKDDTDTADTDKKDADTGETGDQDKTDSDQKTDDKKPEETPAADSNKTEKDDKDEGEKIGDATITETPDSTVTEDPVPKPGAEPVTKTDTKVDPDGTTTITDTTTIEGTQTTTTTGKSHAEADTKETTEDTDKVDKDFLDKELGNIDWNVEKDDKVGTDKDNPYKVVSKDEETTGNKTKQTLTLEKVEETKGNMTAEDIAKLVDADRDSVNKQEDGSYTLKRTETVTDEDGNPVTRTTYITVKDSEVTIKTTTTITVTREKEEHHESGDKDAFEKDTSSDFKLPDIPLYDKDNNKVDSIDEKKLNDLINNENTKKEPDGDKTTYTVTVEENGVKREYTITKDFQSGELTADEIAKRMGNDFVARGDDIFYKDANGKEWKLTVDQKNVIREKLSYTIKVTETKKDTETNYDGKDKAEAEAKDEAVRDALKNAVDEMVSKGALTDAEAKELKEKIAKADIDATKDGKFETSVGKKNFTLDYKAGTITTTTTDNKDKDDDKTTDNKDYTVSGSSYVTSGTVSWTDNGSGEGQHSDSFGDQWKLPEGAQFVKEEGNTKIYDVISEDGKTTIRYEVTEEDVELTQDEKEKIAWDHLKETLNLNENLTPEQLKEMGYDISDVTFNGSTKKVSWKATQTVTETETKDDKGSYREISLNDSVKKTEDGKYTIKINGKEQSGFTSTDGKTFTKKDGDKTITVTVTDGKALDEGQIKDIISKKYDLDSSIKLDVDLEKQTVSYKDSEGNTHTFHYENAVSQDISVKEETKENINKTNESDLIAVVREKLNSLESGDKLKLSGKKDYTIKKNSDGSFTITDSSSGLAETIKNAANVETKVTEIVKEIASNYVNYGDLSGEDIWNLLDNQQIYADGKDNEYITGNKDKNCTDSYWPEDGYQNIHHKDGNISYGESGSPTTKFDSISLDAEVSIKDEKSNKTYDDGLILSEGLTFKYGHKEEIAGWCDNSKYPDKSFDDKTTYNKDELHKTTGAKDASLSKDITVKDGQIWNGTEYVKVNNKLTYSYTEEESNAFAGKRFYNISGQVAYDKRKQTSNESEANDVLADLKEQGYNDARIVSYKDKDGNLVYNVYAHVTNLEAIGYMTASANTSAEQNRGGWTPGCGYAYYGDSNGGRYDLRIQGLKLVDGKVQGNYGVKYSLGLTTVRNTGNASDNILTVKKTSTTMTTNTKKDLDGGEGGITSGDFNYNYSQDHKYTLGNKVEGKGDGFYTSFVNWVSSIFHGESGEQTKEGGTFHYDYDYTTVSDLQGEHLTQTVEKHAEVNYDYTVKDVKDVEIIIDKEVTVITPDDDPIPPVKPETPPVQDATPDPETPVTPENPELPPVQDARPDTPVLPSDPALPAVQDAHALPQTGVNWLAAIGMALSGLTLMITGAFTSLTYKDKH